MRGPIFLSASVPDRDLNRYVRDPIAVREAIRGLVAHVVVQAPLVFGGHPAITPLVWEAARSLNAADHVVIYQSEKYRDQIPKEAAFFKNLVWTPAVLKTPPDPRDPFDKRKSLVELRDLMIRQRIVPGRGSLPEFEAGVFIGGMDGVEEEWALFRQCYPETPVFPIASTEGAARLLFDDLNVRGALQASIQARLATHNDLLQDEDNYRDVIRALLP
jgi:hypothetical protein